MAKISDEIRKWCADLDSDDILCTTETLYTLAYRIDRELVELPRDADGVPIHVGETVYLDDGSKAVVTCIKIERGSHGDVFKLLDESFSRLPNYLTHTRPDSWERIANELEGLSVDSSDNYYVSTHCSKLADRIRKLAKEQTNE